MVMEIVEIHAQYATFANAKLVKLAKRAAKYAQVITWAQEPFDAVEIRQPLGKKTYEIRVPMVRFCVEGLAPKIGEFEFVAELERVGDGVIVTGRADANLGDFGRDWAGECQHCGTKRNRTLAYVVRDANGPKIVGKTCLRDHMGIDAPAGALAIFQHIREINGLADEDDGFGGWGARGRWTMDTVGVLAGARAAIRLYGWVPASNNDGRTTPTATAVRKLDWCSAKDAEGQEIRKALMAELERDPAEYFDKTMAIVDWADKLPGRSDYERNVKVAVASPYVIDKTFAIVISAAAAYDRQVARKNDVAADKWFGEIGARVVAKLVFVKAIGLPDNGYGPSVLHVFHGPSGEPIKWITGRALQLDAGDTIAAKFTIKDHKTYNEMRETRVCRLVKMERAA